MTETAKSQYWDGTKWVSDSIDWANPNQAVESASSTKENEVNIEDPNMWQQVSTYIANRLTTASDLAKRVADLERALAEEHAIVQGMREDISREREENEKLRGQLAEVQVKLDHEQRAVHDLVMERDIVVEERNKAQEERDNARRDAAAGWDAHKVAEKAWEEERQRNHILEERCNNMAQRVAAFKAAFSGLSDL